VQPADVWFDPGLVIEILAAEVTPSPNHTAGVALRFPRFTGRWRDDKAPEDATTTDELTELYRVARRLPSGTS
jgi:DNA ligase-1